MKAPQAWETPFDSAETAPTATSHLLGGVNWQVQARQSPLSSKFAFYLRQDGDVGGFWAMHFDDFWEFPSADAVGLGTQALEHGAITRLFFLDPHGKPRRKGVAAASCLWVRADGTGGWNPNWSTFAHEKERFVPFRWRKSQGFATFTRRSFESVWRELQLAQSDPQSDFRFAQHWAQLTCAEREDALYLWPQRDRLRLKLELEGRLNDALLSDDSLWKDPGADWVLNLVTRDDVELRRFQNYGQRQSEPMSERLMRATQTIWARFEPFDDAVLNHMAVRRWKEMNRRYFQGRATTPTMHERLEAMLRWRDENSS